MRGASIFICLVQLDFYPEVILGVSVKSHFFLLMNSTIKLIKNRSDIGAGTRGSDMGIDAVEIAAINNENDFFNKHPFTDVPTHNETVYNKVHTTFARRIQHVIEQCARVCECVQQCLTSDHIPVVLSGDHSSALGSISGIKAAFPSQTLGVVWIDAHADLHSPYTSPSGNVHGMPLAAALNLDNREHQRNSVTEKTQRHWEDMKNLGTQGPKLDPTQLIQFGVRDTEEEEDAIRETLKIRNYMVEEIRYRGLHTCIEEVLEILTKCDLVYISFDVDSLDCDMVSPGTGTPVSKGFDPAEVLQIISAIVARANVCCLEIAEINPLLDTRGNRMAEVAFHILEGAVRCMQSKSSLRQDNVEHLRN